MNYLSNIHTNTIVGIYVDVILHALINLLVLLPFYYVSFCLSCRYSLYMLLDHLTSSYHQNINMRYAATFTIIRHGNYSL
jgi:hypothetical protein